MPFLWAAVVVLVLKVLRWARYFFIFCRPTSENSAARFSGGYYRLVTGSVCHFSKEAGTVSMANTLVLYFSVGIVTPLLVLVLTLCNHVHKNFPSLFVTAMVGLVVAELSVFFKIRSELAKLQIKYKCYFGHPACQEHLHAWGDTRALREALEFVKWYQVCWDFPLKPRIMMWLVGWLMCAWNEYHNLYKGYSVKPAVVGVAALHAV